MIKLEYIWIDGGNPTAQVRSKVKVVENFDGSVEGCPEWGFDGSSTMQAEGKNSDCILKPVRLYFTPANGGKYLVLCEVYNGNGTIHDSNNRSLLREMIDDFGDQDPWVGIEQEYTLMKDGRPLGWPDTGEPEPQGDYYCGRNSGESIANEHLDLCLQTGLQMSGINAEVMLGQWEYQIGTADPLKVSDDLWVARWLLEKVAAKHGVKVSLHPKPVKGDWNGAGAHTNFSTKSMREENGDVEIHAAIKKLSLHHDDHIEMYGADNEQRLTGDHETCSIEEFKWGISDRGASIRVPAHVSDAGCGYLEDRRPAANCDPYQVCSKLIHTICK